MTIFAVYILLMMLVVSGIGVDLMRNEIERAKRQNTLDRALLAATNIDKEFKAQDVVDDYFAKSGFANDTVSVIVDEDFNYRKVTATMATTSKTTFMKSLGQDGLPVLIGGAATDWAANVEVSFALDVSGSMRLSNRLGHVQEAAKTFVETVLEGDMALTTSVNLIPFAGQTNPGPFMFDRLGGKRYPQIELAEDLGGVAKLDDPSVFVYPNVSSCLEFGSADFGTTTFLKSAIYPQTPHFVNDPIDETYMDWGWCPNDDTAIQYGQNSVAALHDFINDITLFDGDGGAYAMKYALALLEPSSQEHFEAMSKVGLVPEEHKDRPAHWTDTTTEKYIVLLSDGALDTQYRPADPLDEANPTEPLTHRAPAREVLSAQSTNAARFQALCDSAKAEGREAIIYAVAFEANAEAESELRKCASSPAHFFSTEGDELDDVMLAIGRQIRQLRLVY